MKSLVDLQLAGKKVLIRVDFNVPLQDGLVVDDYRIKACLPTINYILDRGASIALISHLGRPEEGRFEPNLSLEPVASILSQLLGRKVNFLRNWIDGICMEDNQIAVCENVRFLEGEISNDKDLSKKMANLCDIFVNDAFACAHRSHASTCGVASFAKIACAGPLLLAEIEALERVTNLTKKPIVAIVGGGKVSTKITLLENLATKVDYLIVGGGIANTLLKAQGKKVGASLVEKKSAATAENLVTTHRNLVLPEDIVCAKKFEKKAIGTIKNIDEIESDDQILDFGPRTMRKIDQLIEKAETIIWNGPVGVFEFDNFQVGTKSLSMSIARSKAFSVAGGGDTVAAVNKFGIGKKLSYVSTAGGAFLEYLEGKELPALSYLN
ncbi:MAG: phosphoglycerate kinase [Pseudomonadota bacterium]|nr:phosphoglycerate kinase [Pseudomonadota bacterium]